MKKYVLILCIFFAASSSYAQGIFALLTKSQEFFDNLEKGQYSAAHAFFDVSVQGKISPDNLKQLWTQTKANLGELKSMDVVKSSNENGNFQVALEGVFAKDSQNFLLVYNKDQNLIGIFLSPKQPTVGYTRPAYVDTAKFVETEIFVETPGHRLVGKYTYPKNAKNFPVVVFVHGSGPGDMDQTVGSNKPFKDIAEGLASQGIASIRYVKRTLIYSAEFASPFTVKEETLDDAVAAIALAKRSPGADPKKVFVFGHSLGGMLAPRLALLVPDLAGVVLAAAPARKLGEVIIEQNKYFYELSKDTTAAMRARYNEAITQLEKTKLTTVTNIKPDSLIIGVYAGYWADLNKNNQATIAKGLTKQRILVLQGGMDFQVTKTDYDLWTKTLTGKKTVSLKYYPALNHFFMTQTEMGTPAQYEKAANVAPEILTDLTAWIKS